MLIIRNAQFDAMAPFGISILDKKLRRMATREFPERVASMLPSALDEWVKTCMDKGASYGMTTDESYFIIARLVMNWEPAFDTTQHWATRILSWTDLSGDDRALLLRDYAGQLPPEAKAHRSLPPAEGAF